MLDNKRVDSHPNIEVVELFKRKFTQQLSISGYVFDSPTIDVSHWAADQYIINIKHYIWEEKLETQEIKCPIDWKEAFRERWFPRWILKRYPIKYHKKMIEAFALYPRLRMKGQDPIIHIAQSISTIYTKEENGGD